MKNLDVHFSSKSENWETPQDLFDSLNNEFNFTLDAAADNKNYKVGKYYTKEDNSLEKDWSNEIVWLNPPYNDIYSWCEKSVNETLKGATVVSLIPSRTDTRTFHEFILPFSCNKYDINLSYFAGLIDGEGCIRIDRDDINKNRKSIGYRLELTIKMTDKRLIEYIGKYFNRNVIYEEKFEYKKNTYRVSFYGEQAYNIICKIYPYLTTKKSQAYYAIRFFNLVDRKLNKKSKKSDEYLQILEYYYQKVTNLKKFDTYEALDVEIRFIRGRLSFVNRSLPSYREDGNFKLSPAPFPSCIVIFKKFDVGKSTELFKSIYQNDIEFIYEDYCYEDANKYYE